MSDIVVLLSEREYVCAQGTSCAYTTGERRMLRVAKLSRVVQNGSISLSAQQFSTASLADKCSTTLWL